MKVKALFLIFLLFFVSCRKYEDGPSLTLTTKKQRLTGDWMLEQVLLNRISQVTEVSEFPTIRLQIDRPDTLAVSFLGTTEESLAGNWHFIESKESLEWVLDSKPTTLVKDANTTIGSVANVTYDSLERFDIRRLTNNDLWIVDKYNNILKFKGI